MKYNNIIRTKQKKKTIIKKMNRILSIFKWNGEDKFYGEDFILILEKEKKSKNEKKMFMTYRWKSVWLEIICQHQKNIFSNKVHTEFNDSTCKFFKRRVSFNIMWLLD
jgi:hypothetical protein